MFTVGRKPFLDACILASKSIPVRTTMPVLQCLKITATPLNLTVFGTDLDSETTAFVNDSIIVTSDRSETCVPAAQIIESLRLCADEEVVATLGKNNLKIVCGRSSFTFPIADPQGMPVGKFDKASTKPWTYDRDDLLAVLNRSVLACDEKERQYSYDKVLIDGRLFIGTDGKRIAIQELESTSQGDAVKVLVLPKTIQILGNMLRNAHDDTANLYLTANSISVSTSSGIVTCRTAQGSLPPNVDRILPKHMPWKTEFVVSDLLAGVNQASIMTDKTSSRITFDFSEGELTIRSSHATGKVEAGVTGDIPKEMKMKIHFDPVYLREMLRTLNQKEKLVAHFISSDKFLVMDIPNGKYGVLPLV